jgi:ABC-type polysaccharide/polyol phosphate transport system ATPase subunit
MSEPAQARIHADGLGVKFWVDSHRRPLTPALARLRRKGSVAWGVKDLDLTFEPGERVALVGPSGSGKTTLLRVIAGVLPADAGTLEVIGRVGCLLSTDAGLLPTLTGRENAVLLGVLGGLSRAESKADAERVRSRSGLDGAFDRHASSMSAGMKARLGVATAWETDPQILLLDEVHEALDLEFREELASYVDALTASGGIVVAAGQDLNLLGEMCRRGIYLRSGEVQMDGPFAQARDAYFENEHTRG